MQIKVYEGRKTGDAILARYDSFESIEIEDEAGNTIEIISDGLEFKRKDNRTKKAEKPVTKAV